MRLLLDESLPIRPPLFLSPLAGEHMTTSVETLEAEVLSLPAADRSRLLDRLIASLDTAREADRAWAEEARRRDVEIESGAVAPIPADEVLEKLRAGLR